MGDRPLHILLVEDSDLDAELVQGHLRKADIAFDMVRATGSASFGRAVEAGSYDVVITDYSLPDLDGITVIETVRDRLGCLPVIVVSGVRGEDFATSVLRAGATDYVLKRTLGRLPVSLRRAVREHGRDLERRALERLQLEQQSQYRSIFEATSDGILIFDTAGRVVQANPAACLMHGYDYDDFIGRHGTDFVSREDHGKFADFMAAVGAGLPFRAEGTHRTRGGGSIDVEVRGGSFRHAGAPHLLAVVRDVTERRQAEEQQALLVRELSHRVKNMLATVQSLINFTLRTSGGLEDFRSSITSRIASLAQSHTLLTDNDWRGASLRQLILNEVAPHGDGERVSIEGPDLDLPAETALTFGMVIHEMTTNAIKYGSLSVAGGRLDIAWSVEPVNSHRRMRFSWVERGGPPVRPPSRTGFGSVLLRQLVSHHLDGDVTVDWPREGIEVSFVASLPGRASRRSPGGRADHGR